MALPPSIRSLSSPRWLVLGLAVMLSACAAPPSARPGAAYRVVWNATRASDHAAMFSTSVRVVAGGTATVRTDSTRPLEDRPAFPSFTARLTRTKTPGVLQLVTRASLREAARNKKGKLKFSKRNIGSLVPIRPGETQFISSPSDPVHLEVRLERE